jgi:hypothetical protein
LITVPNISPGDAEVTRSLLAITAEVNVSTGARAAVSDASRAEDLEAWSFQRIEDVESLLTLLEDYRRHGTLNPDAIHSVDRLIAKLTVAARS